MGKKEFVEETFSFTKDETLKIEEESTVTEFTKDHTLFEEETKEFKEIKGHYSVHRVTESGHLSNDHNLFLCCSSNNLVLHMPSVYKYTSQSITITNSSQLSTVKLVCRDGEEFAVTLNKTQYMMAPYGSATFLLYDAKWYCINHH